MSTTRDGRPVRGTPAPRPIVVQRAGLQAADSPAYPVEWTLNPSGLYTKAQVGLIGATWATTDTDVTLVFGTWRRFPGGAPEFGGRFSVTAFAKYDAVMVDVGTVTYAAHSITDDGQTDIVPTVTPARGAASLYIVTAEPADEADPAFFGWAAYGGESPELLVQRAHLPVYDASGALTNLGWVGGVTPGGTVESYSVRAPNIREARSIDNLDGADFAVVLETVEGTPGAFTCDVTVVLS